MQEQISTRLRDGTPVLFRPIAPEDKDSLRDGLQRLSPQSRYQRFLMPVKEFTPKMLRHLTEIDYRDHMAWVALDMSRPQALGIGVARYVRLHDRPSVAEVGLTVVDSHQRRGLGKELLKMLARTAGEHGIEAFESDMLADNAGMLKLVRRFAGSARLEAPGILRFSIPVANINAAEAGRRAASAIAPTRA